MTGEIIAAIADRRRPTLDGTAAVVFDVAGALVATGAVPAATFAVGDAALGRQGLVELVGLVGYYTMVAMTLNAFAVPTPDGALRLP